jgi:hypothetical protein
MPLPRPKLPPWHEWIVVAAILGGLWLLFWPVIRDSRGPRGDPIPSQPPQEANRVHHPAGFSIVCPPRWEPHVRRTLESFPETLILSPQTPGPYARRSSALIVVNRLGTARPTEIEGLQPTIFQGQPAFERMQVVRTSTFDDPAWSNYELVLSHGPNWYLVSYGIAEERTTLPPMIQRYLNTLRWDD